MSLLHARDDEWLPGNTPGATLRVLDSPASSPVDELSPALTKNFPAAAARSRLNGTIKRAMDFVLALWALVVLSPILVAIAVAVALIDGRPILFRQARAGLDGRSFTVLKFRTMVRDADGRRADLRPFNELAGAAFKMSNDPRVTPLGRFLRRTSLDELPQFINVLRGDMSIVGPRPHPFDDVAGYKPWHRRRLVVKPGITGLWQISARRETDFDRWVELDLEYIRTWSLWLDIVIMLKTIPALLRGDGR